MCSMTLQNPLSVYSREYSYILTSSIAHVLRVTWGSGRTHTTLLCQFGVTNLHSFSVREGGWRQPKFTQEELILKGV